MERRRTKVSSYCSQMVVFTLHNVIAKEGEFTSEGANRKSFAPFVEQRILSCI